MIERPLSKAKQDALSALFDVLIAERASPFEIAGDLIGMSLAVLTKATGPGAAKEIINRTIVSITDSNLHGFNTMH